MTKTPSRSRRWPHSALAHEVDLEIIEALVRLGCRAEARTEARRFLKRYPRSPRVIEVRALLRGADDIK